MDKIIKPIKSLKATVNLPGDTAISHRAALFASLCKGPVEIKNFSTGLECHTTLDCLAQLGVEMEHEEGTLVIHGKGLAGIQKPDAPVNVKNSAPTARMLCGILAATDFESELICGESICNLPMRRVIEPLEKMGAEIESDNYKMPLKIKGAKLQGIKYAMPVSSSQVKGTLLMAGLLADGKTEIIERIPSRDHFERLLTYFGIKLKKSRVEPKPSDEDPLIRRFKKETGVVVSPDVKGDMITIMGGQEIVPRPLSIPGDISSAAYYIIAGLLVKNSEVRVENVSLNATRMGFVDVLQKMRAPITVEQVGEMGFEPYGTIEIKSAEIKGRRMVGELIPSIIDELSVMAIVSAAAQGTSVIRDAYELRNQKIDRIKSIATNLRKMGIKVGELDDGMAIDGGTGLEGAEIESFGDHRIAMSFAVAGLIANGPTVIKDAECVEISYPGFWDDFDRFASGQMG
jgi:3-phosphoshikimate 1-carboxyvinyltransferase